MQSWVSTIHTVVLTADVFQLFIKTRVTPGISRHPHPEGEPCMYQVNWYISLYTAALYLVYSSVQILLFNQWTSKQRVAKAVRVAAQSTGQVNDSRVEAFLNQESKDTRSSKYQGYDL